MSALQETLRKNPVVRLIEEEASGWGDPVYLVGGLIRDVLLDAPPPLDFDVAVGGSAKEFTRRLARRLKTNSFVLHEAAQIYRIVLKAKDTPVGQIDVAEFQGRTIEEDLSRRDFTVNALAMKLPLGSAAPLDPHGGLTDMKKKLLRATNPDVFSDDPIRLLRAFRFAATLGLNIEEGTAAAIKDGRSEIRKSAGERVRAELLGILATSEAAPWLARMDETRLLTEVFPELEPSRKCAKVYYGTGGVLKHTLDVVARMDYLLANLDKVYPDFAGPLGAAANAPLLRLAALLHDVAKPACAQQIKGRLRFFGHEASGAEQAGAILKRLRFSAKEIDMISTVTRHHLRPGNLAANQVVSDKAVFRFFRDLGDHGISLLLLCWADHASYLSPAAVRRNLAAARKAPTANPSPKRRNRETFKTVYHLQIVSYLLERYFTRPDVTRPARLLSGHDVIKHFKIEPGPRLGEILRALEEAQVEGRVRSREEALRFVRFNFQ